MRPVNPALVPQMYSVQSPWLSSIHRPALSFLTMRLTRGGGLVMEGFIAGKKLVPLLGGGLWPPDGAFGKSMGVGFGKPEEMPRPIIVEELPDSKSAT